MDNECARNGEDSAYKTSDRGTYEQRAGQQANRRADDAAGRQKFVAPSMLQFHRFPLSPGPTM